MEALQTWIGSGSVQVRVLVQHIFTHMSTNTTYTNGRCAIVKENGPFILHTAHRE